MVSPGVLGFLLFFLLQPALGIDNLNQIINQLHNRYGDGNKQYAVGINVPGKYCEKDAALDENFLQNDKSENVRKVMEGTDRVYRGDQLIGAKPKPIGQTVNNYHSEYLLLIKSMTNSLSGSDPLMKTLLKSNPSGCAIFFTMNSPCVKTCSTPTGPYSIIPALEAMFKNRGGPKAFVFKKLWDEGDNQWASNIKAIDSSIPVYRCYASECIRCVNGNQVDQRCLNNNSHG